ncbi:MAG: hypothetical protein HYV41_00245 [Candidatus Magasanikbacteria bacterium]|nr:hypothetical protein [Candidatus Magasanikbacteria bacterium]
MKKYSSNRAQKGKTAYRTPSRFKIQQSLYEKVRLGPKDHFKKLEKFSKDSS